ncbi:Hypothetical predicted protein [Octopus vulgaris]|uniref:Uncharacterized protein n=1 Tax=Octopus vulgaris TaxID=6645 RepID=A0AA36BD49_OCTVU|nr:Hypothetical predicted protein [Octopus vulgaris]
MAFARAAENDAQRELHLSRDTASTASARAAETADNRSNRIGGVSQYKANRQAGSSNVKRGENSVEVGNADTPGTSIQASPMTPSIKLLVGYSTVLDQSNSKEQLNEQCDTIIVP